MLGKGFYVVEHEQGAENDNIQLWGNKGENPAELSAKASNQVNLVPVPEVPGAFQLLNVLSHEECHRLIDIAETLGFNQDAAVSLPRHIRHNDSLTWLTDNTTESLIWQRCQAAMSAGIEVIGGMAPLGINQRFRFYKYGEGDFFKPHTDGSWPGSKLIDGVHVQNAFDDRYSQMTFLILLSEDFDGGDTQFWINDAEPSRPAQRGQPARQVNVRTPAGSVLCFPHGMHPLHCVHSSEPITRGTKYIIRTDLLFPLD
ncbi:2OG-Fe(II) oxygenase [Thalassotalea euphylliae]|uniref:Oxidoreductase n=1 Tax=Thalassotalea euphylliae TaxID=1655234 RepID=A0A3E0TXK8_9GAMM|nr:2OG-Fe(II) oxygenase [Thalassotalea euphylliae]REL29338.1 oxidoreductase [Thalassotalea euphylliae]